MAAPAHAFGDFAVQQEPVTRRRTLKPRELQRPGATGDDEFFTRHHDRALAAGGIVARDLRSGRAGWRLPLQITRPIRQPSRGEGARGKFVRLVNRLHLRLDQRQQACAFFRCGAGCLRQSRERCCHQRREQQGGEAREAVPDGFQCHICLAVHQISPTLKPLGNGSQGSTPY